MPFQTFDSTDFPMLDLSGLDWYVQWLPVTKIQFEYFLCDARNSVYDERWYNDILELNPRVTPRDAERKNYWNLFITGIRPDEAREFAEWCGEQDKREYTLPTAEQWRAIYEILAQEPPLSLSAATLDSLDLKPRTQAVLERIDKITTTILGTGRTLAGQMLMENGVMEWVETPYDVEWRGMGSPASDLQSVYRVPTDPAEKPRGDPYQIRLHYYGFRLIVRK